MVQQNNSGEPDLKTYMDTERKCGYVNKATDLDTEPEQTNGVTIIDGGDAKIQHRQKFSVSSHSLKSFGDETVPVNKVGFLSYYFISWISPLVWRIFKTRDKPLTNEDIWQCSEEEMSSINLERVKTLWDDELRKRGRERCSFMRVWLRFVCTRVLISVAVLHLYVATQFFVQAYMIRLLVSYLESPDSDLLYGLGLVALMLVGNVISASSNAFFNVYGAQTGARFRAGILGLLSEKMLKLQNIKSNTMAEITTIYGADSWRIYNNCAMFPLMVVLPMYLLVTLVFMYFEVGFWCFISIAVCVLVMVFQLWTSHTLSKLRKKALVFTDQRIRKSTEIFNFVKLIKMYVWERSFQKDIEGIKRKEQRELLKAGIWNSVHESLVLVIPTFCVIATLVPYYLINGELKASTAFAVVGMLNCVRTAFGRAPDAAKVFGESRISFQRIKKLMLQEEYHPPSVKCLDKINVIELDNATFNWDITEKDISSNTCSEAATSLTDAHTVGLNRIRLNVKKGTVIGICGQVASGKSSLISAIIGRMPKVSGRLAVSGSVGYVAQQAWIYPGSFRENIILGLHYNPKWYQKVIKTCGLEPDLAMMPKGDETEIGERGINVSGGQKQRISLARAVYSDRDIYLLDDPLSAVDVHVGTLLMQKCIKELLKGKTVLLVSQQLQYLRHSNDILVMKDGAVIEQGDHRMLTRLGGYYSEMLAKIHSLPSKSSIEGSEKQDSSVPINVDEKSNERSNSSNQANGTVQYSGRLTKVEEVQTGNVSKNVYSSYMKAIGALNIFVVAFIVITAILSTTFSEYWLSIWLNTINSQSHDIKSNLSNSDLTTATSGYISAEGHFDFYVGVYCVSGAVFPILNMIKPVVIMVILVGGAERFHNKAFDRILKAPMEFFDSNPTGRIMNRFSRDMDEVDVYIPSFLDVAVMLGLYCLVSLGVAAVNLPWILTAFIPVIAAFCFLAKLLSVTIRQIKRYQSVARSPLLSFTHTIGQGLFTIVSLGRQNDFQEKSMHHIDVTTTMLFLFDACSRWIGLLVDLLASSLGVVTSLVLVLTKGSIHPEIAALVLSMILRFVGLMNVFIRICNQLEARFSSIERIHEYAKEIEVEKDKSSRTLDSGWPTGGRLKFTNVVMKYRKDMNHVLHHINLDVKPKEKIGIVGRTGAGKSSLAVALFRLADLSEGNICIDGVNIADIQRHVLRSKLSTIPQDPVLFAGTLRYNLDPFEKYTDEELWSVLDKVKIKDNVKTFERQLYCVIEENGENFSVGERQLICLARAILRKNKILILDEATASVDIATDEMIQETIQDCFSDSTVLTIAHRLHTVLHCDRVVVIDNGKIMETGAPQDLLANHSSLFYSMMQTQNERRKSTLLY